MLTLSPSAPVGPGGPSSPGLPCQDTKIKTFHVIITTFLYRRGRGGGGAGATNRFTKLSFGSRLSTFTLLTLECGEDLVWVTVMMARPICIQNGVQKELSANIYQSFPSNLIWWPCFGKNLSTKMFEQCFQEASSNSQLFMKPRKTNQNSVLSCHKFIGHFRKMISHSPLSDHNPPSPWISTLINGKT